MKTFWLINRIAVVLAIHSVVAAPAAVFGAEVELRATWNVGVSLGTPQVVESAWPVLLYLGPNLTGQPFAMREHCESAC